MLHHLFLLLFAAFFACLRWHENLGQSKGDSIVVVAGAQSNQKSRRAENRDPISVSRYPAFVVFSFRLFARIWCARATAGSRSKGYASERASERTQVALEPLLGTAAAAILRVSRPRTNTRPEPASASFRFLSGSRALIRETQITDRPTARNWPYYGRGHGCQVGVHGHLAR